MEASTYFSEIVAIKNTVQLIEALQYNLRMFEFSIDGPTKIFCDNEAVNKNCLDSTYMLKNKHHLIAYYMNNGLLLRGLVTSLGRIQTLT